MTHEILTSIPVGTGTDIRDIAVRFTPPADAADSAPIYVWFGGYRSDMMGTKAIELAQYATQKGAGCIRFDYSGHGESGGAFMQGTISRWLQEAMAVIDHYKPAKMVFVGSSMGGWIALRAIQTLRALKRQTEVAGLLLIAPAPDFTRDLIEPALGDAEKASLAERGYFEEVSDYSPEPNIFTKALLDDGANNIVLDGIVETGCGVHILQGMQDADVPYQHALKLLEHLPQDDVVISLIKDGDHRLSRPQDIALMRRALAGLGEK